MKSPGNERKMKNLRWLIVCMCMGAMILGAAGMSAASTGLQKAEERLRSEVKDYILQKTDWQPHSVTIGELRYPSSIRDYLLRADTELEISRKVGDISWGMLRLLLTVRRNGEREKNCWILAETKVTVKAAVLMRDLPAGSVIGKEDIEWRLKEISKSEKNPALTPASVIGKKTRISMTKGETVSLNCLDKTPVIRRGERAKLFCRKENLEISMFVEACENGYAGESIKVKNSSSRKILQATVGTEGNLWYEAP